MSDADARIREIREKKSIQGLESLIRAILCRRLIFLFFHLFLTSPNAKLVEKWSKKN